MPSKNRWHSQRRRVKPAPTKEQLAVIAAADAIMAACTHLNVRPLWLDQGPDAACQFCRTRTPHSKQTHYFLLNARVRRLARGYPSKVRQAERNYRKLTGRRWPMEKTLWHEVFDQKKTCRELAPIFGVCFKTVANWCARIGIQDPEGEGCDMPPEYNEFEVTLHGD